jgi:MoaA/NifB/PqqE/SkfB family radical SAM enzyme
MKGLDRFNPWKGLLYADWYKGIVNGKLLPPVEASIDPIHQCPLACEHCNSGRYLGKGTSQRMPDDHLVNLIGFLGEWGVKAVRFSGGGEPTLHSFLPTALELVMVNDIAAAVETNGVVFGEELVEAMANHCSWVSVSVDAATRPTFAKIKGADVLNRVLANIEILVKKSRGKRPGYYWDLCFGYLISTSNAGEVYEACRIAKDLGCTSFHARPIDYRHQGIANPDPSLGALDTDSILAKFAQCHELEDEGFRVFTEMHKFNSDLNPRREFQQCWGAPLSIQLCADGVAYFCTDQRLHLDYALGEHYPDPKKIKRFWGKKRHLDMLFGDTPHFCKNRCTVTAYSEQCEKLFAKGNNKVDRMCWRFP